MQIEKNHLINLLRNSFWPLAQNPHYQTFPETIIESILSLHTDVTLYKKSLKF